MSLRAQLIDELQQAERALQLARTLYSKFLPGPTGEDGEQNAVLKLTTEDAEHLFKECSAILTTEYRRSIGSLFGL